MAGIVAVFTLPLVLALSLSLGDQREDPPAARAPQAFLDCVPFEMPDSVADINRFVRSRASSPSFLGADVGASARLSDGRSIWVFGDTVRRRDAEGPWLVRNSIMIVGDGCASVYVPADRGAAIPNRGDGVGYWPTSIDVIRDEEGYDRIAVGLFRVRGTGRGTWDFEILGSSVARFNVWPQEAPELVGVTDVGLDGYDGTQPLWGAAVEVTPRWVYIYGTAKPEDPWVFGHSLHVARTTVKDYLRLDSWRFWDGERWVIDRNAAAPVLPAENGVSTVLSVFRRGDAWYAVSKRNEFVGTELVIWKADSPTGPFQPAPPVAEIPSDDHLFRYMPLAHPDLLPREDSVVVSWSNNVTDPSQLRRNARSYRPTFLRVPLP